MEIKKMYNTCKHNHKVGCKCGWEHYCDKELYNNCDNKVSLCCNTDYICLMPEQYECHVDGDFCQYMGELYKSSDGLYYHETCVLDTSCKCAINKGCNCGNKNVIGCYHQIKTFKGKPCIQNKDYWCTVKDYKNCPPNCMFCDSLIKKPTHGVYPRYLHEEKRIKVLVSAITKRGQNIQNIPKEWLEEYNDLVKRKESS